jgi:hypothetical protein
VEAQNVGEAEKAYTRAASGLSHATRRQLADYARAHTDELRQGGAEVNLGAIEAFIRERVIHAGVDSEQVEPEVATITGMLFQ